MRTSSLLTFIVLLILQTSCSVGQNNNILTTDQVLEQMEKGGITLLDVRTPKEWNNGIIEGAVLKNMYDNDFKQFVSELDKDKPIIVTCKVGGRSAKAVKMMRKAGIKEVYDMSAGMDGWKKDKKPTIKPEK